MSSTAPQDAQSTLCPLSAQDRKVASPTGPPLAARPAALATLGSGVGQPWNSIPAQVLQVILTCYHHVVALCFLIRYTGGYSDKMEISTFRTCTGASTRGRRCFSTAKVVLVRVRGEVATSSSGSHTTAVQRTPCGRWATPAARKGRVCHSVWSGLQRCRGRRPKPVYCHLYG